MRKAFLRAAFAAALLSALAAVRAPAQDTKPRDGETISISPVPIAKDPSVRYDYDIVYVRSPRWIEENGKKRPARWAEFGHPFAVTPGSDLVLLHPDGREEVLAEGGAGAIQDPYVSFDAAWVYYTKFHRAGGEANAGGADIFKVHVATRKTVQLTKQEFATNKGMKPPYGVYNIHPCPAPGGKVLFVSNRNAFLPPPKSYPQVSLQLHSMDEDGGNVETIGHLNLGGALHPVILKDGRVLFASLENMGLRNDILWGIWAIHPDGTNWSPVVSAFSGTGAPSAFHFQSQLSDGTIIIELYYNQNQKGFGTLFTIPPEVPPGESAFGPGSPDDPRNPRFMFLDDRGRRSHRFQMPFTPYGMKSITPWIETGDRPSPPTNPADPASPRIGKLTHPCGAPDNHLLVAWTLGPIGGSSGAVREFMGPQPIDSGLCIIKGGRTTNAPGDMVLIKNDPDFNEQWPRPVVPYRRIYGVDEPRLLEHRNDGKASPHLPEGTPFGLVGTSSLYKRESAPLGAVAPGGVTAVFPAAYKEHGKSVAFEGSRWNWRGQGADAGRYANGDIHALRILSFEPNAHSTAKGSHQGYPPYHSHAMERLRILGEIPVRKFTPSGVEGFIDGREPADPDGNPDTSFLAKLPADVAFTFQAIDRDGMVLNMAQTWHQLRPGEIRNDCGGCHAHSQRPTPFKDTFAALADYRIFDLTRRATLVTSKARDESGRTWDAGDKTGLRFLDGPHDVEYFRDVQPILKRSCTACHTKTLEQPAAGLVLDDDETIVDRLPGSYYRLAADQKARFGPKPLLVVSQYHAWQQYPVTDQATRYIAKFQSRRSLLIWKVYGKRLDGWTNDEIASVEIGPDDPRFAAAQWNKEPLPPIGGHLLKGDIDYLGSAMPPPEAVEGAYRGPDGKPIKVPALSDEERRMIVRWIDLGCPIDLDPARAGGGLLDDQRPTLTVTSPAAGSAAALDRIVIGMHDYNSGLEQGTFEVKADFAVGDAPPGTNLAPRFKATAEGTWSLALGRPHEGGGTLVVSVRDRAGNESRVVRSFRAAR